MPGASTFPVLSDVLSDSLGREYYFQFAKKGTGYSRCRLGTLLPMKRPCSLFAPPVPPRGFRVEFLLIHFQERFTGGHLNTALSTQFFLPDCLDCQAPGFTARWSRVRWSWDFPPSYWWFGFLPAGGLVAGVGQSPPNAEMHWGLLFMAEKAPDVEGWWVGLV